MLKARKGFTLIELLIVVVIIGILAAIAIPKFGKTREKAYFSAMKSDLKNLMSSQEIYYSNGYSYAPNKTETGLDYSASKGVNVKIGTGDATGWNASATHDALGSTQGCYVFYGDAPSVDVATVAGVISCKGE